MPKAKAKYLWDYLPKNFKDLDQGEKILALKNAFKLAAADKENIARKKKEGQKLVIKNRKARKRYAKRLFKEIVKKLGSCPEMHARSLRSAFKDQDTRRLIAGIKFYRS